MYNRAQTFFLKLVGNNELLFQASYLSQFWLFQWICFSIKFWYQLFNGRCTFKNHIFSRNSNLTTSFVCLYVCVVVLLKTYKFELISKEWCCTIVWWWYWCINIVLKVWNSTLINEYRCEEFPENIFFWFSCSSWNKSFPDNHEWVTKRCNCLMKNSKVHAIFIKPRDIVALSLWIIGL